MAFSTFLVLACLLYGLFRLSQYESITPKGLPWVGRRKEMFSYVRTKFRSIFNTREMMIDAYFRVRALNSPCEFGIGKPLAHICPKVQQSRPCRHPRISTRSPTSHPAHVVHKMDHHAARQRAQPDTDPRRGGPTGLCLSMRETARRPHRLHPTPPGSRQEPPDPDPHHQ